MNIRNIKLSGIAVLAATLALGACTAPDAGNVVTPPPAPEPAPAPVQAEAPPRGPAPSVVRRMIIADLLFDAREAYDNNRLMRPSADNAHDRYREVLQLDPGNPVALAGIRDIALRYVQLADTAMGIGQHDNAAELLARAATLGGVAEEVQAARQRLEELRKNEVERYALDPVELRQKSPVLMARLGEIAQALMNQEGATFLITARTDAEGRWIYQVMREAVGGYRLRGNIAVGEQPSVQVQIPAA